MADTVPNPRKHFLHYIQFEPSENHFFGVLTVRQMLSLSDLTCN